MATALRLWVLASALSFSWLPAQTGALVGTLKDAGGGLLPGVTVTARSEGRPQTAVTNDKGEYRFDQLQPGRYRIDATLTGFFTAAVENVVVEAGRAATWNATLQVVRRGPADPFGDFQTRVKQIVGPDAIDCGQHRMLKPRTPEPLAELQKSLTCGLEAAEQKKAFWMSFQAQGIDSTLFRGVAGTTTGTMYRLSYDSDPSGGSGATPRFSAQPCAKPSVNISRGGYTEIVCGTG